MQTLAAQGTGSCSCSQFPESIGPFPSLGSGQRDLIAKTKLFAHRKLIHSRTQWTLYRPWGTTRFFPSTPGSPLSAS